MLQMGMIIDDQRKPIHIQSCFGCFNLFFVACFVVETTAMYIEGWLYFNDFLIP